MDNQYPRCILSSQLFHKYGGVHVTLYNDILTWKDVWTITNNRSYGIGSKPQPASIHAYQVREIVAVHKTYINDQTKAAKHLLQNPYAFTVFYVRRMKQHQWQCDEMAFHCSDQDLCERWIQAINDQLSLQTDRPKSLLVYVNPFGGKRQGKCIYDQKVAPLFSRACISTDVIGSTDCTCFATVGTNDAVTSALHIIIGDSQPMDVCSVYHGDTFLRYSVTLLGYGFYGDILSDSEQKRWLGPARYNLSGVKTFLTHNYYEGTVSFVPAEDDMGSPRDKEPCRSGCCVCQRKASLKASQSDVPGEKETCDTDNWTEICGKFIAINVATMSCASPQSWKGLSPSAHLADGTADLILVRECSRLDFFKHLLRHTNKEDQFDHSFVEVHRVRKFRFQPSHQETVSLEDMKPDSSPICSEATRCHCHDCACSHWTCDGEILPHVDIQASVQCQLITLFARGIEETHGPGEHLGWLPEAGPHQSAG
ncbi:ceramide kinase isoform X5 [Nerophis lumbriciformis]|uniref:ceramide kinase isoform X5 n=1 Tax=Nerophis lumbriciformis TaxID=546530 RepID=UPI002AE0A816|nr:ceramide kinase-like isoform X5 [Nerophis lumbriciformis]